MKGLVVAFLVIGIILSVKKRKRMMMWRSGHISSPLSKAITQLVGTAGGIYISLEMLIIFLGVPEYIWNPELDYFVKPLAIFSILIAIIQPYVLQFWIKIRRRRD